MCQVKTLQRFNLIVTCSSTQWAWPVPGTRSTTRLCTARQPLSGGGLSSSATSAAHVMIWSCYLAGTSLLQKPRPLIQGFIEFHRSISSLAPSRGQSSGSTVSVSSGRREGRRRKSAAPEMWIPNNWGHSDPDVNLLGINEGEKKAVDDEGRDASCPLAVHPFLSLASTTADPVTPSRDSILVIPPICFSGRC